MNITIKEKAKNVLLKKKVGKEKFLRIKVVEGGCAGMTYDAEIDHTMKETESVVYQTGEIRIVSEGSTSQYLDGLIIDYSDDLVAAGLRFDNTKSTGSCSCGASFNLSGFPTKEGGSCCS